MKIKHEVLKCSNCQNELFGIKIVGVEDERLEVIAVCTKCFEPITTNNVEKQKKANKSEES